MTPPHFCWRELQNSQVRILIICHISDHEVIPVRCRRPAYYPQYTDRAIEQEQSDNVTPCADQLPLIADFASAYAEVNAEQSQIVSNLLSIS